MSFIPLCSFACPSIPDIDISKHYTLLIAGMLNQNKFPTVVSLDLDVDFKFANPAVKITPVMGVHLTSPAFLAPGVTMETPISWMQFDDFGQEDFTILTNITLQLPLNTPAFISTLNPTQTSGFNATFSCSYQKNFITDACSFTPVIDSKAGAHK